MNTYLFLESYEDDDGYDYAYAPEAIRDHTRADPATSRDNGTDEALITVENPYYGVEPEIHPEDNGNRGNEGVGFQNVQVTENPYYE